MYSPSCHGNSNDYFCLLACVCPGLNALLNGQHLHSHNYANYKDGTYIILVYTAGRCQIMSASHNRLRYSQVLAVPSGVGSPETYRSLTYLYFIVANMLASKNELWWYM